jgi:hypothetical protein
MSSMAALAGALGGAPPGGPPGLGPGGPPVDLGAGGGPPVDLGAPPLPPDQGAPSDQFSSSVDALDAAETALHAFIALDEDEPDKALAAQALQQVLKLKASNQTAAQNGDMKGLARALQGAGAPAPAGGGGY